jgi:stage V sporulation protein SpoVS
VTVKADTSVKDAAGAIVKVLNRTCSTFVTALRLEASHESLNRALKALAVSRKYMTDQEPGKEVRENQGQQGFTLLQPGSN